MMEGVKIKVSSLPGGVGVGSGAGVGAGLGAGPGEGVVSGVGVGVGSGAGVGVGSGEGVGQEWVSDQVMSDQVPHRRLHCFRLSSER